MVFGDHLGSASLLTDAFGRPKVLYDYYPFGSSRMEQQVGGGMRVAAYQYTGKEKDQETGLYNYGARYYEAAAGRFTQSDPVSLKIAASNDELKRSTGQNQQQLLANPQVLNSYAYTANNPVKYTDPNGEFLFLIPAIPYIFTGAVALLGAYSAWQTGQTAGYALEGDYVNSELAAAKNQLALTAIAVVGEGALAVMPLTVTNANKLKQAAPNAIQQTITPGQQITSAEQVPENVRNTIPKSWGSGDISQDKQGWRWQDPKSGAYVRFDTGHPDSPFVNSQNLYVKVNNANGQPLDKNGNLVIGYDQPKMAPEAHIPLNEFNPSKYSFLNQ